MAKPSKACAFCQGNKLSKEHFWPVWASSLLPESTQHTIARSIDERGFKPVRIGQGSIKKAKLRVVCRTCNNGWMSTLEGKVRPVLSPLIVGESAALGAEDQHILSEWIAMKIMVLEQSSPPDVVLAQADRTAFMDKRTIPTGMKIYIATCGEGVWESASRRHSAHFAFSSSAPDDSQRKNVQTTTFGIGKALIHTATSILDGFDLDDFVSINRPLFRLWPYSEENLTWPNTKLSLQEATALSDRLELLINSPRTHQISR